MDARAALEVAGLTLAVLDFFGLSHWLEAAFDAWRQIYVQEGRLLRFAAPWLAIVLFVLVAFAFVFAISLTDEAYSGARLQLALWPAIVIAMLIVGSALFWLVLHLMNMAPKGIVGSLGLLLAVGSFVLR